MTEDNDLNQYEVEVRSSEMFVVNAETMAQADHAARRLATGHDVEVYLPKKVGR